MTLNLDIIGKRLEPVPFSYDQDSVILYALGIGAGVQACDRHYPLSEAHIVCKVPRGIQLA